MFSVRKVIRVRSEDSAFVYFILESYEGITSYSTLDFKPGEAHRDLELRIPPDFVDETEALLKRLGDLVITVPPQRGRREGTEGEGEAEGDAEGEGAASGCA